MKEILPYVNVAAIIAIISLWLTVYKWKRSLHDDIVTPDIDSLRAQHTKDKAVLAEEQKRQDARLDKLEKRCDDLKTLIEEKFDAIVAQQIEMTKQLAGLSGKLEVIIKNFPK